jgi:glycosyltransferase involved in cell wall biosynthesis
MSDVVFAQSRNLAERCLVSKKEVEIFPFGVNMELFSPRECSSTDLREEPRAENFKAASSVSASTSVLPRPVIGYVGGIHKHFDAPMLSAMARARPRWSWALVGPLQTAQGALERIPNIHLLGPKAHEELPHYICDFDVGIVPYLHNDYTMTVVPTKIKEYLAMGKPVVSTNLPEVNAFNDKHNVIITSSNHPTEFLSSIEKALDLSKEEVIVARRRKVAALHDWEERLERMSDNIEHKLNLK